MATASASSKKLVVTMRTEGVQEIVARLREIIHQADNEIATQIVTSASRTEADAANRVAAVDHSGAIRAKLKSTFRKRKNRLVGEVRSSARHSFFVEFGTGTMMRLSPEARREGFKPGKGTPYFPRLKKIEEWLLRTARIGSFFPGRRQFSLGGGKTAVTGISREESAQKAFLVARAIHRKGGTPPRPWLFPAWGAELPRFLSALRAIGRGLGRRRGR